MKTLIKTFINIIKKITLAKLISVSLSIILISLIKYIIIGKYNYTTQELIPNIFIANLTWLIHISFIPRLSEFLGLKGINFNIYELFFGIRQEKLKLGYDDMKLRYKLKDKLYNSMDSTDNKGKEVDKGDYKPFDPTSLSIKHTNPGPGFNVPGGKVPIRDPICQHIDYNSHYLSQFRSMSLETAMEQRTAYLVHINVINGKLAYARDALLKVPEIPTNEYELKLRNTILKDIDQFSKSKTRTEGRITLINSRIEFIEKEIKKS